MKYVLVILMLVLLCLGVIGIWQKVARSPVMPYSHMAEGIDKDASVNMNWRGPGSVKLHIGNYTLIFAEGQSKKINLSGAIEYIIIAEKPDRYYQKHRVRFDKGDQSIFISIQSDSLIITNPMKAIDIIRKEMVMVHGSRSIAGDIKDFYISKYDITQRQWEMVMGDNPSYFKNCPDCPVERVSWNDANEFIEKLNKETDSKFRLPTEAEWEYAAKGSQTDKMNKYAGGNNADATSWYSLNSKSTTHPVGSKKPNGLGLYDMTGNVWQWCSDYAEQYPGRLKRNNVEGETKGLFRIVRGGSWINNANDAGIIYKEWIHPDTRDAMDGFRLVQQF